MSEENGKVCCNCRHNKKEMTLEEAIKRYTSNAFYEKSDGNLQGYLEFNQLAEWLKELKQLREQTSWTPVSEGLPEEKGFYLVSVRNEHDRRYSKSCWYHGNEKWFAQQEVEAWMPSLEPYKGRKK